MTVIKIKNSNVSGRLPASGDIEIAELALNIADKKLYSKDAAGSIFEIGVAGDLPSGPNPPNSGNNIGDLFFDTTIGELVYWDGSGWIAIPGDVDGEGYVKVSGSNMTGDLTLGTSNITLDAGNGGITALGKGEFGGTVSSESSFLAKGSYDSQDCFRVTNSNVSTATIFADGSGTFAGGIRSEGDAYAGGAEGVLINGGPDRDFAGSIDVCRDGETELLWKGWLKGTNTTTSEISAAGAATFQAGISARTQDAERGLTIYSSSDSELEALAINANGGDRKILLNHDGTAEFAGDVQVGLDASGALNNGLFFSETGRVTAVSNPGTQPLWTGYTTGNTNNTSQILADGSATFNGTIRVNNSSGDAQTYLTNDGSFSAAWGQLESGLATYISGGDGKHYIGFDGNSNVGTIVLDPSDGSAEFEGNVNAGSINGASTTSAGTRIYSTGEILIQKPTGSTTSVFSVYNGDSSNIPVEIKADGSASFGGYVESTISVVSKPGDGSSTAMGTIGGTAGFLIEDSGGNKNVQIFANGNATFSGTVTATVVPPSDARFKENIEPAKPQLADVVALGGLLKNYDWNDQAPLNEEIRSQRQLGLIAQEAETVCPAIVKDIKRTKTVEVEAAVTGPKGAVLKEAVTKEEDDSYKGISQDALIMKLIGAVAELSAEVTALKAVNTANWQPGEHGL